jgi:translation initiation factor 2 subunit 1
MVREEWPERGELVVCTVQTLENFGAFVALEDYEGKEGLIHIAQISSGWVKHLRDHVREGQKVVCKVLYVDPRRGHIDLSLKDVKESQRREKIKEWKNERKATKWLALALAAPTAPAQLNAGELAALENALIDAYGGLYDAFEDAVQAGIEPLLELGIAEEIARVIQEIAVANIKLPMVQIKGYVELRSSAANGVDAIKEALIKAEEVGKTRPSEKEATVECFYIGAPRYTIRVKAPNYKEAENVLSEAAAAAIEVVKRNEGVGKFYRNLPERG